MVMVWALRLRVDAVRCGRGGFAWYYCFVVVATCVEFELAATDGVAVLQRLVVVPKFSILHFGVVSGGGVVQITPWLSRLQLFAVCTLHLGHVRECVETMLAMRRACVC